MDQIIELYNHIQEQQQFRTDSISQSEIADWERLKEMVKDAQSKGILVYGFILKAVK